MTFVFGNIAKKLSNKTALLNKLSEAVYQQDVVQDFVIEEIQERLSTKGEDSQNQRITTNKSVNNPFERPYSINTEPIKRSKAQRFDVVTLKDSGEFYRSFKMIVGSTFMLIDADFNKKGNNIADNFTLQYKSMTDFENAILKMTQSEFENFLQNIFLPYFNRQMQLEFAKIIRESK